MVKKFRILKKSKTKKTKKLLPKKNAILLVFLY